MKFLDKKEQVLELQMTQYGKSLLSRGKFEPMFYAFFDDDIIYDTNIGYNGHEEVQKESENRIKSALRPKSQTITYGLEEFVNKMISKREAYVEKQGLAGSSANAVISQALASPPPTKLNNYTLKNPLGTSKLNSFYVPYWDLNSLVGEIKSTSDVLENDYEASGVVNIPQIDIDVFYETFISTENSLGEDEQAIETALPDGTLTSFSVDGVATTPGSPEAYEDTSVYAPNTYNDGTQVLIRRGFSLIDLVEGYTNDNIENFDIEVYEVVDKPGGSPTKTLKKMKFRDNDYLELGENQIFSEKLANEIEIDSDYVEYYFEIKVDDELEDVVRALKPETADPDLPFNNFEEPCED